VEAGILHEHLIESKQSGSRVSDGYQKKIEALGQSSRAKTRCSLRTRAFFDVSDAAGIVARARQARKISRVCDDFRQSLDPANRVIVAPPWLGQFDLRATK
jgi:hypothetical protein